MSLPPEGSSVKGLRLLRVMIVAEVALAVTLVAGAGSLVRSLTNLQSDDPGFTPEGRIVFDVLLPFGRYQQPEQRSVWIRTLLEAATEAFLPHAAHVHQILNRSEKAAEGGG